MKILFARIFHPKGKWRIIYFRAGKSCSSVREWGGCALR